MNSLKGSLGSCAKKKRMYSIGWLTRLFMQWKITNITNELRNVITNRRETEMTKTEKMIEKLKEVELYKPIEFKGFNTILVNDIIAIMESETALEAKERAAHTMKLKDVGEVK
jgi:hypothetical protein